MDPAAQQLAQALRPPLEKPIATEESTDEKASYLRRHFDTDRGRPDSLLTLVSGRTGHAESVRITYDPSQISYGQLLQVFFEVAHDPTELNRQGPDVGSQYRSVVFYANEEQKRITKLYIQQLDAAGVYPEPIVTQISPLDHFYAAEEYHQNYLSLHPTQPYILFNDIPKLTELERSLPGLYRKK